MLFFPILFIYQFDNTYGLPLLDPVDTATREHTAETLELSYKRLPRLCVLFHSSADVWSSA